MKCQQCSSELNITAKFCHNCGAVISITGQSKKSSEVTREWFASVLLKIGYEVTNGNDQLSLVAKHKERCNLFVHIKPNVGFIGLQSLWNGKKAGWGKRGDLAAALNKANASSW